MTTTPAELTAQIEMARKFHEAYERLAPSFGYETQPQTRVFDPTSANGRLMTAVCAEVLAAALEAAPIPMILHCPACHLQHIDAPEESLGRRFLDPGAKEWDNPPHRSHLCHGCGSIWRPADVPTEGVAAIQTKGSADGLVLQPTQGSGVLVREALANIDAARRDCPIEQRKTTPLADCPKCGATRQQGCGPTDRALGELETAVRAMISAATPADGG